MSEDCDLAEGVGGDYFEDFDDFPKPLPLDFDGFGGGEPLLAVIA